MEKINGEKMRRKVERNLPIREPIGILSGKSTFSWEVYKERANIARKRGIDFVQIIPEKNLCSKILNGDNVNIKYWDGKSMHELSSEVPQVIYDRLNIQDIRREEIMGALRDRGKYFINPPEFREICADKLKTHKLFLREGIVTPETYLFSSENLEGILKKKGFVFVKKRISSQGKNQIVIRELGKEDYLVVPSSDDSLQRVNGFSSLLGYLEESGIGKDYLVQEGIDVDRIEGRTYDFRALFQRGSQGKLHMTCFYTRIGAPLSEQANIGKRGHAHDPSVIFREYDVLKRSINDVGKKVIDAFSKEHEVGEAGIDFVFDKAHNLFVIEVNSKPGSKGIRTLREWNPLDKQYENGEIIPYEYNNTIRKVWGRNLDNFLARPILYGKYLLLEGRQKGELGFETCLL